jgi:large subunit ribosomal protein L21
VCPGVKSEIIEASFMYAILETGGKQYRVTPGEVLRVGKLDGDIGSELELPALAVFQDGGELLAGAAAGRVKATIVGNGRAKKILVFKFKRKKQYKRTIGHRQDYTRVQVEEILG